MLYCKEHANKFQVNKCTVQLSPDKFYQKFYPGRDGSLLGQQSLFRRNENKLFYISGKLNYEEQANRQTARVQFRMMLIINCVNAIAVTD